MIGYYIVEGFTGEKDAAGFDTQIKASNRMDMNIKNTLYLPPYLRKSQCNISIGDTVFGIVDDVTGIGCALFGENAADFKYFFDADIEIKRGLSVADDVVADDISLIDHIHNISEIPGNDAVSIYASGESGGASPATLAQTSTDSASMPIISQP